ncbi:hypothetical protein BKA81DRAFT_408243 [Phyllosticta paracitricarpa]|uniref:Metallo-beta-lactamase domain-containing protein n=1 Tax=Phyllosticta citricarpa TaxID=55181 RepID=A0ABR1LV84_9PEZI
MRVIGIGQADTHDCLVLRHRGEANTRELRQTWIASVRKIQDLKPDVIVPGHEKVGEATGPWHLANTIRYIENFQKCVDQGFKGPRELGQAML